MARQKLTIDQVKQLQAELDSKASAVHNHTSSDITDFNTAAQSLIDSSITTLKAETDPFPQYLTDAEGDAQYSQLGHSHTLDELSDVVLTTPLNGQVLKFDGTNWVNQTDSAVTSLADLTDTTITTPSEGQLIKYNATSGKWENFTPDYAATVHTHVASDITDFSTASQTLIDASITALKAETDPFPQYLTDAEGDAQYSQLGHTHTSSDITDFNTAVNSLVNTAINAHEAEADPHSQYLTQTEADALYAPAGAATALSDLSDVVLTPLSAGQVLKYNGTNWINGVDSGGSGVQGFAVQDTFTATAGQTIFTLSTEATGVSIVSVNGVQQKQTTDYSISGTSLIFTYALTLNDEVIVTYGTNLASSIGIEDQIIDGVTNKAPSQNAVFDALILKQNNLISGTNIKTVNGQSLLGSGNLTIAGGSELDLLDTDVISIKTQGTNNITVLTEGIVENSSSKVAKTGLTYLSGTTDGMISDDYGNIGGLLLRPTQNNSALMSCARPVYSGNNGYKHVFIAGIDYVLDWTTNTHMLFGLISYSSSVQGFGSLTSLLSNGSFDAVTTAGFIGVMARPGSSNLEIVYRPVGGTSSSINLGSNFPKTSYRHLRIEITKLKSSSTVTVLVKDIINGFTATHELTTNLPASDVKLQPGVYVTSAHTSGNANVSFVKMIGLRNYA